MTDGCYFRVAYGALQKATVAEGVGRLVSGLRVISAVSGRSRWLASRPTRPL